MDAVNVRPYSYFGCSYYSILGACEISIRLNITLYSFHSCRAAFSASVAMSKSTVSCSNATISSYGKTIRGDETTSEDLVGSSAIDEIARRIVACWNTCNEYCTEEIEGDVVMRCRKRWEYIIVSKKKTGHNTINKL